MIFYYLGQSGVIGESERYGVTAHRADSTVVYHFIVIDLYTALLCQVCGIFIEFVYITQCIHFRDVYV